MTSVSPRPHTIRQGLIAGLMGAAAVAVWFLVLDLGAGRIGATPELLGHAFFSAFGPVTASAWQLVAMYTVVHCAAFAGIGIIASWLVVVSHREPTVLAGLAVLFVVFETLCTGIIATMAEGTLGALAWWQIGGANLMAAAAMGTYLFRRNPGLGTTLDHALSGQET
jgi:hypothetical protein